MRQLLLPLAASVLIGVLVAVGYWFGGRLDATDGATAPIALAIGSGDCRVYPEGCSAVGPEVELQLRFLDRPNAMTPAAIELHSSVPLSSATVDFEMAGMDMGLNRYRLEAGDRETYRAKVMLPVCVSGRRDWIARVQVVTEGRVYRAEFPFETYR